MSRALLALVALPMVLVVGCGPGGSPAPVIPSPSPSPSVPPTVSPSPSPSPPPPPVAAPPVPAAPPGFVDLADVDATILHDIRYHSEHNFVGRRIDGYLEPRCLLTERAARALSRAQASAQAKGYSLKVYDCYRPLRAAEDFKRWGATPGADAMKAEFYPGLSKRDLFSGGYVSGGRSAHSRGSTVDLTVVQLPAPAQRAYVPGEPLVPCTAPARQRFPDNTADMGTGYDCFDALSHTLDGRITGQARQHRLLLREVMTGAGFRNYPKEWWHYGLVDEPHPAGYFDFPVTRAALGRPGGG